MDIDVFREFLIERGVLEVRQNSVINIHTGSSVNVVPVKDSEDEKTKGSANVLSKEKDTGH